MAINTFFDSPSDYKNKYKFYKQGGSPKLLKALIDHIESTKEEIEEICFCWYLFNNPVLHNYLKELSKQGIRVTAITIPLEGYDNSNSKEIIDMEYKESYGLHTKYSLAKEIFSEMYHTNDYPNYRILFFPHLYVRSKRVKKFSRGQLPYSLHIKSVFIIKKNGSSLILSSSNMAVRDLVKHESMLIIEDEKEFTDPFNSFITHLKSNSIELKKYNSAQNTSKNEYEFINTKQSNKISISAPFYFDSSHHLEKQVLKIIQSAKQRIIVCAQHLAAYNYKFNSEYHSKINGDHDRIGILGCIIKMASKGIDTKCISQTFVPPAHDAHKFQNSLFRKPMNTKNFTRFFQALSAIKNAEYYVNEDVHSKFIIIDNTLIFCTYNFTPTQFTFLDKVQIDKFDHMDGTRYNGIHCEIGAHIVIENKNLVAKFVENINHIIKTKRTIKVL